MTVYLAYFLWFYTYWQAKGQSHSSLPSIYRRVNSDWHESKDSNTCTVEPALKTTCLIRPPAY